MAILKISEYEKKKHLNRNLRLVSPEADPETSVWMQVISNEAVPGKSGKSMGPQVREWKEATEGCDLKKIHSRLNRLKGNSGIFHQVSEQDNPSTCESFVKSWLKKGREGTGMTFWLWVLSGKVHLAPTPGGSSLKEIYSCPVLEQKKSGGEGVVHRNVKKTDPRRSGWRANKIHSDILSLQM